METQVKIRDSIFHVWYYALGYLGGSGTGFIISRDNKFYFVTASHCLDENYQDLCITNLLHKAPKKLPFSKIIRFNFKEDDRLDICFVEIDLAKILRDIKKNNNLNAHVLCKKLLLDPEISRIMRRCWSVKTKMNIRKTPAYICQNKEILSNINYLPDSDVHTKSLKFIIKLNYEEDEDFYFMGYPDELQSINCDIKKVNSQLIGLNCKYARKMPNSGLHELNIICDNIKNYRGFSGSPVFYNKNVCGIVIRAGNKKAYFADFKYVFELLDKQIMK